MARKKAITLQEHASRIAPLGGKASMRKRTAEERGEFARAGGRVGGRARASKLSAKRRKEIAQRAAAARWGKPKTATGRANNGAPAEAGS
jgi:hypothetical protein